MAHHSDIPFDGGRPLHEFLKTHGGDEFKKSMPVGQAERINEKLKEDKQEFGATGNFPDGGLNESDEGEIRIGITSVEDRVIMNFGKPIEWIGFTKEQAAQIAESLIKHSK